MKIDRESVFYGAYDENDRRNVYCEVPSPRKFIGNFATSDDFINKMESDGAELFMKYTHEKNDLVLPNNTPSK